MDNCGFYKHIKELLAKYGKNTSISGEETILMRRSNFKITATDGPFMETKEYVTPATS